MSLRRVVIADYGIGNLLSVARALEACGAETEVTGSPERIALAERLVLPGVGAFGNCMDAFLARGLEAPVSEFIASGRPMLGLCIGMQILFDRSLEFGDHAGLGIIPGEVRQIPRVSAEGIPHKTPHIGWADIGIPAEANDDHWQSSILHGLRPETAMYFVHSFAAWPKDPAHRIADAFYGGHRIAAAVSKDNVYGTQFHPEKSGTAGLTLLRNFLEL
jgi:imidazole glycerol-phosphate synthase subunit HisH